MEPDAFTFATQPPPDHVHIRLVGMVVVGRLERVARVLSIVEEHPASLVDVDLAGVSFIDSSGVAFLLALKGAVEAGGGRVRFQAASARVRRILERAGVGALLYDAPVRFLSGSFAA